MAKIDTKAGNDRDVEVATALPKLPLHGESQTLSSAANINKEQDAPRYSAASHSEIIREASDSDTSEAIAASSLLKRPKADKQSGSEASDPEGIVEDSMRRIEPNGPVSKSADALEGNTDPIDQLRAARAAELSSEATSDPTINQVDNTDDDYQNLVLHSTQMKSSEIASFVAQKAFTTIQTILEKHNWESQRSCPARIISEQMKLLDLGH
ncbi:hypothetical protein ABLN87_21200 [Ruegeria sp. SCPT10]|uniref:hypothetical protein n=1 Tax=Ruegeria sp. SCP10 TaxID=3141377 RepID=UPI003338DB1E